MIAPSLLESRESWGFDAAGGSSFGMSKIGYVRAIACAAMLVVFGNGCVKRSEFDAQSAQLEQSNQSLGVCAQDVNRINERLSTCEHQLAREREQLQVRAEQATKDLRELQSALDESTALNASVLSELERLGGNLDKLHAERGVLETNLAAAKARLEELRRAQAAAERRNEQMHQLVQRFRKMADAGQLVVTVRKGRMVLQMSSDVLFDSGRAAVKPQGTDTILQLASVLRQIPDRQFQVEGHTDNEPIASKNYPSNWYLSVSRAIKVVEILIHAGVKPTVLSAAGYGEFDPIAPNDSELNRQKNRRIEIVMQPNVDELVTVSSQATWGDSAR